MRTNISGTTSYKNRHSLNTCLLNISPQCAISVVALTMQKPKWTASQTLRFL
ncbi:hypothetical protein CEV31_2499 [Brucella thiophenivorans]|uniref:Uncharacterized protein n=1 Tax=Brucella thiophenivorans TaxID=571255 RepID=A0A256FWC7_9HYPH|nr:hypothetical protein CEV31_2499 [Brucella thiophenivorans]